MSLISLVNSIPFGNPAERGFWLYKNVPPGLLQKLEANNFRRTVAFVSEHSPFYKKKLRELGIELSKVQKPEDLGNFFTTAEDIRQNPKEFLCANPDTAYETTGTTSRRTKRVYFSRAEVREAGWAGAVGLWGLGVRPEDRVVSAFDYSFWVSGPVLEASCDVLGCFHVEAGRMDPREFYERLADYGITVIVGDPSWMVSLSDVVAERGLWAQKVKLLLAGGENLTEDARRKVEKIWNADFLLSYGQTEAFGAIGMESRDKQGYHLNEFHNFFEIINRDKNDYGELVYTTLNRRTMPLVRYRSGDLTRFLEGPTPSGLPGRRIEKLKGRIDEWIPTAMGNLAPWMFEPVFALEGLSAEWQIVIHKKDGKDWIEFHAETAAANGEQPALRERFFLNLREQLPDAWRAHQMRLLDWDLKLHPIQTLRTGRKLPRLVDRRIF